MAQEQEIVIVDSNGVEHIFPEGMDPSRAAAIVRAQAKAPVASVQSRPSSVMQTIAQALPSAGGVIGGLAGGVPGAAIGGAAGRGYQTLMQRAGEIPGAVADVARNLVANPRETLAGFVEGATGGAQDAAMDAAVQGASEVGGRALMKGAQAAGRGLMDFAIRPAPTVAEEFGDIAATAIKERVPVGSLLPGGPKGSNAAARVVREASGETRALLDEAGKRVQFKTEAVARGPVTELVGRIAKQPLSEAELQQVSRMFSEYLETQPTRMRPRSLKDMKQAAQRIARPIFRALNQGNIPPAGDALRAQFNKAVADGAKETLESIPGVAQSEARTQAAIGLNRAVRRAESRRLPLVAELAAPVVGGVAGGVQSGDVEGVGKGVTAAMLTRALLSPRTTSRAALVLTQEQVQQALRQMPRAAVYQLLEDVTGTTGAPPAAQ